MILLAVGMVAAQASPSAMRALGKTTVTAGESVVVTITASGIGGQGVVTETLPAGFAYISSTLPDSQVRTDANDSQKIHFVLADSGDSPFTYTVTVSQAGTITGDLTKDRVTYNVTGQDSVAIQQQGAGPSAMRALGKTTVTAGESVVVTITASGIGGQGVVTETLPAGFAYISSTLPDSQVRTDANDSQKIHFVLADSGDSPFTYTVTVSQAGTITGDLTKDRVTYNVTGQDSVAIQQQGAGPSAMRALGKTTVTAGESVVVTITASGIGGQGVVTETLPAGFAYISSTLPDSQVRTDANDSQKIHFVLADSGDSPFTYTVTVSQAGTITGDLTKDRVTYNVTGQDSVAIQQQGAGPSAMRALGKTTVTAGESVVVTITASGIGGQGVVTETLPAGFAYISSTLPDSQVRTDANDSQKIHFVLADSGDSPFTYTVTVSQAGTITGKLTKDRMDYPVGGASRIGVGIPPRPPGGGGGGGTPPPANRTPVFGEGDSASRSVAENSAAGTAVGSRVRATDRDGDRLTYRLSGTDASLFSIDSSNGQISVAQGADLDYETKNSYAVSVRANDPFGSRDTISITIRVTNVEEDGRVNLSPQQPSAGTELTAALTDPDGSVSNARWAWERSADRTTWTAIAGARSSTYTPVNADEGHYLRATVAYTDGHGANKSAVLAFTSAVSTATPEPTVIPTVAPEPTATATPTTAPEPTATATPTTAPEPTATATPTAAPEPTATATPTAAPEPTATATPTVVPPVEPEEDDGFPVWAIVLIVVVVAVAAGGIGLYVVRTRS